MTAGRVEPVDRGPRPLPSAGVGAANGPGGDSRRRVLLTYYSKSQGRSQERTVDPYKLYQDKDRWWLAGYCHLRKELRTFAVENIREALLRQEGFTIPEELLPGSLPPES